MKARCMRCRRSWIYSSNLRADPATKQPDQYARPSIWAQLAELFGRIRYKPGTGRDIHLDFLRGWCIFSMVVDHAAGERHSLLFGVTGNGPLPPPPPPGLPPLSRTLSAPPSL